MHFISNYSNRIYSILFLVISLSIYLSILSIIWGNESGIELFLLCIIVFLFLFYKDLKIANYLSIFIIALLTGTELLTFYIDPIYHIENVKKYPYDKYRISINYLTHYNKFIQSQIKYWRKENKRSLTVS